MAAPSTRYARSGDIHLAYQVVGEGPRDGIEFDDRGPVELKGVAERWDLYATGG